MKGTSGLSIHGERKLLTDKDNKRADFPTCNVEESWEYAILCGKHKQIRDDCIKVSK